MTVTRLTAYTVLARLNQVGALVFLTLVAVTAAQAAFGMMLFWLACTVTSALVAHMLLISVRRLQLLREETERFVAGLMAQLTQTGDFEVFMTPPDMLRNASDREKDIIKIAAEVHQAGREH
jgi:hypothetical protein